MILHIVKTDDDSFVKKCLCLGIIAEIYLSANKLDGLHGKLTMMEGINRMD